MLIIEQLGSHDEVLDRVRLHPLFKSFRIREDDCAGKEHFPVGQWHPREWKGKVVAPPADVS